MTRFIGRISDRMLSAVVPKVVAQACTLTRMGCCDFCMCRYCCPDGTGCTCRRCSCTICG